MINRRHVRETVLQALYALKLSGDSVQYITDSIIKDTLGTDKELRRFAEKLFFTTLENENEFDAVIIKHIKNWEFQRLALVDRLILKLSLCEFLYFDEIPTKVTINEAIEIAKKFSTAKSGRFVNGILDASLEDLSNSGKINKKGRGLIDHSINQ
ncbi:MAG TPA: transcription antitermination factor NusB [Balneola sp.]|jgi:transcription antitermination protein NusB|nr:transcription antitermination factor NusB [Bacteroidota bacterium]MAC04085.1 transcription antitermination factor NusB [Balneola sp.]MAO78092.1 transcription antitermination factor NusB [Balneola sp.]MBF64093.1 transcription antitermination factor NusB [Balneola sp.]HAH52168.1 transcription antitermination factor NusB [Balneola sp.]|tara:strand:- start:20157 stop:20621 length:465 start_codon:yes stop_codon:yes gene_type:complete